MLAYQQFIKNVKIGKHLQRPLLKTAYQPTIRLSPVVTHIFTTTPCKDEIFQEIKFGLVVFTSSNINIAYVPPRGGVCCKTFYCDILQDMSSCLCVRRSQILPYSLDRKSEGNNNQPLASLPALLFYYMRLNVFSAYAAVIIPPYPMYIQAPSTKPM